MKNDDFITSKELEYIIEVNQKAITIYNEVAQQNEDIADILEKLEIKVDNIEKVVIETNTSIKEQVEKKVETIEKNVFRLIIILTSGVAGIIYTIIQSLIHH